MPPRREAGNVFYDCILCERPFLFGPYEYDGRHIPAWDMQICNDCLRKNIDGIVPKFYPKLVEHLCAKKIQTALNGSSRIDIPSPYLITQITPMPSPLHPR